MALIPKHIPLALALYEASCKRERQETRKRYYLGMSAIGDPCDRKLWFGFRGYTPELKDGRLLMLFRLGARVEDEVVELLIHAGFLVTERQRTFSDFNGFFRGHWDGRIEGVTRRPHVLEVKSANAARFKEFQERGVATVSPTYACQVQCYMGYADLERALWVVYNKNTSAVYTERARFNRATFDALRERAYRIITANTLRPRAFADPGDVACRWCDHRTMCWEPEAFVMSDEDRHCRNCDYFRFVGLDLHCAHPAHAFPLVRERWSDPDMVCADYHCKFDKLSDRGAMPAPAAIDYTSKHPVTTGGIEA